MTSLNYLFLGNETSLNIINPLVTAYRYGSFRQGGDIDLMNDPLGEASAGSVISTLTAEGVEVDYNATVQTKVQMNKSSQLTREQFQKQIKSLRGQESQNTLQIIGAAKRGSPQVSPSRAIR
jgi:hypothetical protein